MFDTIRQTIWLSDTSPIQTTLDLRPFKGSQLEPQVNCQRIDENNTEITTNYMHSEKNRSFFVSIF